MEDVKVGETNENTSIPGPKTIHGVDRLLQKVICSKQKIVACGAGTLKALSGRLRFHISANNEMRVRWLDTFVRPPSFRTRPVKWNQIQTTYYLPRSYSSKECGKF